jgi:hypothetical protein
MYKGAIDYTRSRTQSALRRDVMEQPPLPPSTHTHTHTHTHTQAHTHTHTHTHHTHTHNKTQHNTSTPLQLTSFPVRPFAAPQGVSHTHTHTHTHTQYNTTQHKHSIATYLLPSPTLCRPSRGDSTLLPTQETHCRWSKRTACSPTFQFLSAPPVRQVTMEVVMALALALALLI